MDVARAVFRDLTLDSTRSTNLSQQLLARLQSTPAVVERLKTEPDQVVADLEELRESCGFFVREVLRRHMLTRGMIVVTSPQGMRIAVIGDILNMQDPVSAWKENFQDVQVS